MCSRSNREAWQDQGLAACTFVVHRRAHARGEGHIRLYGWAFSAGSLVSSAQRHRRRGLSSRFSLVARFPHSGHVHTPSTGSAATMSYQHLRQRRLPRLRSPTIAQISSSAPPPASAHPPIQKSQSDQWVFMASKGMGDQPRSASSTPSCPITRSAARRLPRRINHMRLPRLRHRR